MIRRQIGSLLVGTLALAGCMDDDGILTPRIDDGLTDQAPVLAALECQVELGAGSMTCAQDGPELPGGVSPVILGGQGVYILLESSNIGYDAQNEIFSADVTVRNLLTQTIGTSDEVSVDEDGIWVFFHDVGTPIPGGSGPITLDNPDGEETITVADQPYFRYAQALGPGERSLHKTWRWKVPAGVESFTFAVYVKAAVVADDEIEPGLRFDARTLTFGRDHTCALTLAGEAYCWGSGATGQLGNGSIDDQARPVAVLDPDEGPVRYVSIAAGLWHTCALSTEGKAYCWGWNAEGQLGTGPDIIYLKPEPVMDPEGESPRYTAITAGQSHTCAIATTGKAYCWGWGMEGQVGNGEWLADNLKPAAVVDTIDGGVRFSTIAAGYEHTCALSTEGRAYCWGNNENGQLGNGMSGDMTNVPVAVMPPAGVADPLEFDALAIGSYGEFTCALTAAGKAYCWGYNFYGSLGDGTFDDRNRPTPVADPAGGPVRFSSIGVGAFHACGLTGAGKAYCWGDNYFGQLGNGETGYDAIRTIPVEVWAPEGGSPVQFVSIGGGDLHTCGRSATGQIYCWGDNFLGQLGIGPDEGRPIPTPVLDPEEGPPIFAAALPRRLPFLAYLGEKAGRPHSPHG